MTAPKKPAARRRPATKTKPPAAAARVFSEQELTAVLEGRRRGLTFSAIAKAITAQPGAAPLSEAEAVAAYDLALAADMPETDPERSRLLSLSRVDTMIAGLWPKARAGDPVVVDKFVRLSEYREKLVAEPQRVKNAITDAFEASLKALGSKVKDEDAALVAGARQVARQIDHAVAHGTSMEATKAMYLLPHLMNALRELGATPAARAALEAALPKGPGVPDDDEGAGNNEGAPVDLNDWKRQART